MGTPPRADLGPTNQAAVVRKRKPRRKAGEPPRERGRPRKDGSPPVPRKARPEGAAGLNEKNAEPPYPATLHEFRDRIFDLARKGVAPLHVAALVGVEVEDLQSGDLAIEDLFEKARARREDFNAFVRKAEAFGVEQICGAFHERATAIAGHPLPAIAALNNRNGMKADRATLAAKDDDVVDRIELVLVDARKQVGATAGAGGKPREGAEGAAEKAEEAPA